VVDRVVLPKRNPHQRGPVPAPPAGAWAHNGAKLT
jgi:hypothetical protein